MQKYITDKCAEQGIYPVETQLIDYKQFEDVYSPHSHFFKRIKTIVESKGGKCLSTQYIDAGTKLEFECKNGHRFFVKSSHIFIGIWCPRCSGRAKHTIEEMWQIAASKGGKCLSTEYKNNHTKLTWQCKYGHIWETRPECVILQGCWCPICAKDRPAWNRGKKGIMPKPWNKGKKGVMPTPWNKGEQGIMPTPWNKGVKGIHFSSQTEFKKGFEPWNKGRKGIHLSPKTEFKKGMASWIKGKHFSEESKRRMSEAHKGLTSGMKGKHHSPESRKKMSEKRKLAK